ncbi:MAG: BatD family protein, partial [Opitutales bacterium]
SWPLALTAVMEGNHDLQYKMVVRVRVRRQTNSPIRDSFFNDPFFGFGHEDAITVASKKHSLKVQQLPMKGRPLSFRGAIGSFETKTHTDASRVTVGDPVKVIFSVAGKGNFGVMPAPEMPVTENLKVGPPAFSFEGDENLKHEGVQKFEYIVTPLRPGHLQIPAVPFSFFDPVSQSYVIAQTKPQTLRVDPGETWVNPNPIEPTTVENRLVEPERKLFQTESDPGEWFGSLAPVAITRSSTFWYGQLAPLLGLVALLGWQFRQNRPTGDSLAKRMGRLRQEMKATSRKNDVPGFLKAARGIIRERVGALVNHEHPEALAIDEVLAILRKQEVSSETISKVNDLLEAADAREFAEEDDGNIQLKEWFSQVKVILKRIRSES